VRVRVDGPLIFNTIDLVLNTALDGSGWPTCRSIRSTSISRVAPSRGAGQIDAAVGGLHLYNPNQRHASPTFELLMDALRYRRQKQA
jgi:hypothetical protein